MTLQQLKDEGDKEFEDKFIQKRIGKVPEQLQFFSSVTVAYDVKNYIHEQREKAYKAG